MSNEKYESAEEFIDFHREQDKLLSAKNIHDSRTLRDQGNILNSIHADLRPHEFYEEEEYEKVVEGQSRLARSPSWSRN